MRMILSAGAEARMLEALAAAIEGGAMRIYDLTPPSSADAAVTVQRHLATLDFAAVRFKNGEVTAELAGDAIALASGTASWARVYGPDDLAILDCDIGEAESGAAIIMNTAEFRRGGPVVIRSFSFGMR